MKLLSKNSSRSTFLSLSIFFLLIAISITSSHTVFAATRVDTQEWAGYEATQVNGGLQSVQGSWTINAVKCTKQYSLARTVVNLGVNGGGAEVIGVESTCNTKGVASYYGIVTAQGAINGFTKLFSLKAGDSVTASIAAVVPAGNYQFTLKTSRGNYSSILTGGSSYLDTDVANCVVERNNFVTPPIPLSNFGIQNITGCMVNNSPIGLQPNLYRAQMIRGEPPLTLAETSVTLKNNTDFTVKWDLPQ